MAMDNGNSKTYEAARKLRVEENQKRFEDLGISNLSKSLSNLTTPQKKTKQRLPKPKSANSQAVEPRRSTRTRNPIVSYNDEMDIDLPPLRKRFKSSSSSWTSYIARPLDEVKLAAYEDRIRALKTAEEFQSTLQSGKPSFVKSMVRSHVYSCFWLGLPAHFCKDHLPKKDLDMILEDENGSAYDAKYLGNRTGLSGGWRGFALDQKLDDGDAIVFELVEPDKFKVYTFRVSMSGEKHTTVDSEKHASDGQNKTALRSGKVKKLKKAKQNKIDKLSDGKTSEPQREITNGGASESIADDKSTDSILKNGFFVEDDDKNTIPVEKNGFVTDEDDKNIEPNEQNGFVHDKDDMKIESGRKQEEISVAEGDQQKPARKLRKKPAPRIFRRK